MKTFDFEHEVAPIEERIERLRNDPTAGTAQEVDKEIQALTSKAKTLFAQAYKKLDSWQTCQVARHENRPQTKYYLENVFTNFNELHGDRMFKDDRALIGGLARLDGDPVMVIGHQKGSTTEERLEHNFGMPHPEGYRKALRLMNLAEKFSIPIITFIDTPGAYCGIGAEERGMSQALGTNLLTMASLRTRIVTVVIGEGGSGGALAVGVADRLLMLEHAVYSVISPEGCASILWREANEENIKKAANEMQMRSKDLLKLNIIDEIIPEPVGGAQRNPLEAAEKLREALRNNLAKLKNMPLESCVNQRSKRFREYGLFKEGRD